MRMHHIVTCAALPSIFSTLYPRRQDFRETSYGTQNVCFDFTYNFCLKCFFFLGRIQLVIIQNANWSSCKVPVILIRCEKIFKCKERFSKNNLISNFMKICPLGGELFHSSGQTDRNGDTVFVALGIRHAMRKYHVVICAALPSIFSTFSPTRQDFREASYGTHNVCFDFT